MTTRTLLLIAIIILAACSAEPANSAANSFNQSNSPQDGASANQRLETDDKYNKISNNNRKTTTYYNNTYYDSKAKVIYIPGSKQVKINIDDSLIIIKLINDEQSYLDFKKGNHYLNKFAEISFNYTYGIDFEDAIQQIKVFKSTDSEQGLLVLPDYTEEYPAYSILPFDGTGIKQSYTAEIESFDCANFDTIVLGAVTLDAVTSEANVTVLDHRAAESISISQKGKACKASIYDSKSIENLTVVKRSSSISKDKNQQLAINYKVTADKLEILDENFNPQTPSNYYVKGDVIEAVSQNEDWVKVRYKNDSKHGWIEKGGLKAVR